MWGMVDFKVTDGKLSILFAVDGYQLVVMPMLTTDSQKPEGETQTAETELKAEDTEPEAEKAEAEAVVKAEKPKRKRSKAKEPVAVA